MTSQAPRPAIRVRLPLATVPDLASPVALHGSIGRSEVGGSACFGIAIGVIKS